MNIISKILLPIARVLLYKTSFEMLNAILEPILFCECIATNSALNYYIKLVISTISLKEYLIFTSISFDSILKFTNSS